MPSAMLLTPKDPPEAARSSVFGVDFFVFNLFSIHWTSWISSFLCFIKYGKHSAVVYFFLYHVISSSNYMIIFEHFITVFQISVYFFQTFYLCFRMDNFCYPIIKSPDFFFCLYIQLLRPYSGIFLVLMLYLLISKFLFCFFCKVSIFML